MLIYKSCRPYEGFFGYIQKQKALEGRKSRQQSSHIYIFGNRNSLFFVYIGWTPRTEGPVEGPRGCAKNVYMQKAKGKSAYIHFFGVFWERIGGLGLSFVSCCLYWII